MFFRIVVPRCQFLALLQRGGVWKQAANNWMIPHSSITVWLPCPTGLTQLITQNRFPSVGWVHRADTAIIPILSSRMTQNLPMATQLVGGWVRVKTQASLTPKPRLWAAIPQCPKQLPEDFPKGIRNRNRLHRALNTSKLIYTFCVPVLICIFSGEKFSIFHQTCLEQEK